MQGMYRPPARLPKGKWALFLHRQRRKRGWSQQQAFEELHRGLRLGPKSRASYSAIDMGDREPKPHEQRFLTQFFESGPDDPYEPEPALDSDWPPEVQEILRLTNSPRIGELIDALNRLARAIEQGDQPPGAP